jgi:hypothetical protein
VVDIGRLRVHTVLMQIIKAIATELRALFDFTPIVRVPLTRQQGETYADYSARVWAAV